MEYCPLLVTVGRTIAEMAYSFNCFDESYVFSTFVICRHQRARPIIIDPGLYHSKKSGVFWAKEKRSLPASFKLFTGNSRNPFDIYILNLSLHI